MLQFPLDLSGGEKHITFYSSLCIRTHRMVSFLSYRKYNLTALLMLQMELFNLEPQNDPNVFTEHVLNNNNNAFGCVLYLPCILLIH